MTSPGIFCMAEPYLAFCPSLPSNEIDCSKPCKQDENYHAPFGHSRDRSRRILGTNNYIIHICVIFSRYRRIRITTTKSLKCYTCEGGQRGISESCPRYNRCCHIIDIYIIRFRRNIDCDFDMIPSIITYGGHVMPVSSIIPGEMTYWNTRTSWTS